MCEMCAMRVCVCMCVQVCHHPNEGFTLSVRLMSLKKSLMDGWMNDSLWIINNTSFKRLFLACVVAFVDVILTEILS